MFGGGAIKLGSRKARALLNVGLDKAVWLAHKPYTWIKSFHPYFFFYDLAILSSLLLPGLFVYFPGGFHFGVHLIALGLVLALYEAMYLKLKERWFALANRSFFQDVVYFVIPVYLVLSITLGQDLAASFDTIAMVLALSLGLMRIGCFLGGCCYGKSCSVGVYYSPEVLRPVNHIRRFSPGPAPGARVFPLQLVESAVVLALLGGIAVRVGQQGAFDGYGLLIFLFFYAAWRFFAEFLRGHRHRQGGTFLTPTQKFSLLVAAGSLFVWVWG